MLHYRLSVELVSLGSRDFIRVTATLCTRPFRAVNNLEVSEFSRLEQSSADLVIELANVECERDFRVVFVAAGDSATEVGGGI